MAELGSLLVLVEKAGGRLTGDEPHLAKVSHDTKLKKELRVYLLPPVASDSLQLEIPLRQRSLGHNCVQSSSSCQLSVPTTRLGVLAAAEHIGRHMLPGCLQRMRWNTDKSRSSEVGVCAAAAGVSHQQPYMMSQWALRRHILDACCFQ